LSLIVCDVAPRDGLQMEARALPPALRAELVDRIAACGVPRIEAVSFVSPRWVPQMADAETVMALLQRPSKAVMAGLVLNERGYVRALSAGVDEIHYAVPVTDSYARENQNTTVSAGLELSQTLVRRARADGVRITVTLIVAFGCPFEGRVPESTVLRAAERVMEEPPDELCLADTIGVAVPTQVRSLVPAVGRLGARVGCHLHNTRNTGFANALAAVEAGVVSIDASLGGIGGCPFAPRATGNIGTEDLVYLLRGQGVATGIDLEALIGTSQWLGEVLEHDLPAMVGRAGDFPAVSAAHAQSGGLEECV